MTELAAFGNWAVTDKGVEHVKGQYRIIPKWALYTKAVPELAAYMARNTPWLRGDELFNLQLAIRKARQLFGERECREALKCYGVKS